MHARASRVPHLPFTMCDSDDQPRHPPTLHWRAHLWLCGTVVTAALGAANMPLLPRLLVLAMAGACFYPFAENILRDTTPPHERRRDVLGLWTMQGAVVALSRMAGTPALPLGLLVGCLHVSLLLAVVAVCVHLRDSPWLPTALSFAAPVATLLACQGAAVSAAALLLAYFCFAQARAPSPLARAARELSLLLMVRVHPPGLWRCALASYATARVLVIYVALPLYDEWHRRGPARSVLVTGLHALWRRWCGLVEVLEFVAAALWRDLVTKPLDLDLE